MLFTQKSEVDIHEMSPLALAFVGDAVLELLVRARLVGTTRLQPNRLHTVATHYVSAHAQNLELDIIEPPCRSTAPPPALNVCWAGCTCKGRMTASKSFSMPCGKGISRSKTKKPSPLGGRWPKTG